MLRRSIRYAVAAATVLGAGSAQAAWATHEETSDQDTVGTIVDQVATLLEESYVFSDIGEQYAEEIRRNVDQYRSLSPSALASRITADLQAVHQDLHLRLTLAAPSPNGGERTQQAASGGVRVQQAPAGSRAQGSVNVRVGAAPPSEGDDSSPAQRAAATPEQLFSPIDLEGLPALAQRLFADEAARNHFFSKLEILPGNVGYMDYDQFGFPNFSTDAADAAFAFLSEVDAMIIDLRNNRGGIEGMNQYLASHFFGEDPIHLYSRYYGEGRTTLEYTTFPDYVQRRFPDLPLYILVNAGTGSAAENFTFAMQGLERATVVGEPTAGAAHSSRVFDVDPGLLLQLPVARAFNPRTDEDWEGTGVIPNLPAESKSALSVAHAAAIDQLLTTASDEERLVLEDAKLLLNAGDGNPEVTNAEDYVGEYGYRRVYVEEGALKMVRTDVAGMRGVDLVRLAPDYFTLEQASSARIRFERDDAGEVVRMRVRLPTGSWEVAEKASS